MDSSSTAQRLQRITMAQSAPFKNSGFNLLVGANGCLYVPDRNFPHTFSAHLDNGHKVVSNQGRLSIHRRHGTGYIPWPPRYPQYPYSLNIHAPKQ